MTFTYIRWGNGDLKGALCDQCRAPLNARTQRQLDALTRGHACPAQKRPR